MEKRLQDWARNRGYHVAWGPVELVGRARHEVAGRHSRGELDETFYRTELAAVVGEGSPPEEGGRGVLGQPGNLGSLPGEGDRAVLVVAIPRPAWRVTFEVPEGPIGAILPPTYARYRATFEEIRQDLEAHALPGARVEHLRAPLKMVAAHLGLVRYGRNNVTYAPGAGSYIQLCGYLTDANLPLVAAGHGGPRLLDECEGCTLCRQVCPTQAIGADRVLLRAERCLTFINESPGDWPDWIPASAHRCLLGCLLCQRACPANPKLHVEETALRFSLRETQALRESGSGGEGREETGIRSKLAWLGQSYAEPVLGRNLVAMLAARRRRAVVR